MLNSRDSEFAVNRFGQLLRDYRLRCTDSKTRSGRLTQERLGELLGRALVDGGYSGAAVSEWELGKSHIHKDQRRVLVNLVKVLRENGGVKTLEDANALLLAGNYRSLNATEQRYVFPGGEAPQSSEPEKPTGRWQVVITLLTELIFQPARALDAALPPAGKGTPPDWPGALLAAMGRPFEKWSSGQAFRVVIWAGVWLLAWQLTFPFLRWPFEDSATARTAAMLYVIGAVTLPTVIALLTRTADNEFWKQRKSENAFMTRLLTHIGAWTGFNVGWMMVFGLALAGYYLRLRAAPLWIAGTIALWPIVLGHAAARRVPFNHWRAFGALRFRDSAIFLVFALYGPLWAAFFFYYYPWLLSRSIGIWLILIGVAGAFGISVWQERTRRRRN